MPKGSFKYHWRENEVKICHCYAEITKLSSEDFVKMVLLDSTYMKTMAYQVNYGWIGIYFRTRYLLENQLPLFILKELHNQFSRSEENNNISFIMPACKKISPHEKEIPTEKEVQTFQWFDQIFLLSILNLQPGENISNLQCNKADRGRSGPKLCSRWRN